jgi:hypothetical protein
VTSEAGASLIEVARRLGCVLVNVAARSGSKHYAPPCGASGRKGPPSPNVGRLHVMKTAQQAVAADRKEPTDDG